MAVSFVKLCQLSNDMWKLTQFHCMYILRSSAHSEVRVVIEEVSFLSVLQKTSIPTHKKGLIWKISQYCS